MTVSSRVLTETLLSEEVALQKARELGVKGGEFEPFSALTVTVPGAAAAWEDTIKMYGRLTLKEVTTFACPVF